MNRRNFVSLLAGAAGAPLVPWRGLIDPVILLPPRPHVCADSFWCNHSSHAQSATREEILAGMRADWRWSFDSYITGTVLTVR